MRLLYIMAFLTVATCSATHSPTFCIKSGAVSIPKMGSIDGHPKMDSIDGHPKMDSRDSYKIPS